MHAAVEHQAHGVVPAAPGRQPVGEHQPAGLDGERQLLGHLAGHREPRRLVHLHDPAGQVPVLLVGQPAQQHSALRVAHQHLRDGPLAGQEGVQQRPEALRLGDRRVTGEPGEDGVLARPGPVTGSRRDPLGALATQAGPGGDPGGGHVVRLDLRLDALQAELAERVVGQQPDRPGGVAVAAVAGVQHPGQAARRPSPVADLDAAHQLALVLDHEAHHRPALGVAAAPRLDHLPVLLHRRSDLREAEPVRDLLVVAGHRRLDVLVPPRAQQHDAVGQLRLRAVVRPGVGVQSGVGLSRAHAAASATRSRAAAPARWPTRAGRARTAAARSPHRGCPPRSRSSCPRRC